MVNDIANREGPASARLPVRTIGLAWVATCLVLLYGFDMGRGFVKDDFGWILHSPLHGWRDVWAAFADPQGGFFRPMVALTFGIDRGLFGLSPMGYAATNLAFVLATIVGIARLADGLGPGRAAGVFAAALWALNFHGVPGALMWISGRTSLLATMFAVWAAVALLARRSVIAGVLTLCALLSKEEPLLLPVVFALWLLLDERGGARAVGIARRTGPSFAALAVYLIVRAQSQAFTPSTAPSFYRLSASPSVVVPNALQYLDRSCTFVAAVLVAAALIAWRRPRLRAIERAVAVKGAAWLVLGFGVTIFVPVRSSLYVCLPSVGSALIGAAIGSALWREVPSRRRRPAIVAFVLLPILLLPVYRSRNRRLKAEAMLSARAVSRIRETAGDRDVGTLVIGDRPSVQPSIAAAFGDLLPDAVELTLGRRVPVVVVPHPLGAAGSAGAGVLRLELRDGDLRPVS